MTPYAVAWQWQQQQLRDRISNPELPDALLLVEHPPVYTLGQGADAAYLRFDPAQSPWEVHRVERGGEVTYHYPGQVVGYPILNLRRYRPDLHWYLRQLEEVVIRTLANLGLAGERIAGLTGVWVDGYKVAAMGIKVSRWITMHGFALNVWPDPEGFARIVPCGLEGQPVGWVAQWQPEVSLARVRSHLKHHFAAVFGVTWTETATVGSAPWQSPE